MFVLRSVSIDITTQKETILILEYQQFSAIV